jgi:RNA polymerase sigma-54 factor
MMMSVNPFAAPVSFHQDLINQLNTFILNDEEREIAEFWLEVDDDIIRRSVPDMVDDMAFTQAFTPMKDGAKNAACYS